jgi:hypothetical protein
MYIDALTQLSAAQAMGAAAVSTNSVDLGLPGGVGTPLKRQIGTGEPVGIGIVVTTAGTVAATLFEFISTTDAALTAGILVHCSFSIPLAQTTLGAQFFLPIPQGTPTQRFIGLRATTAGGTISVSAWVTSHSLFSLLAASYAKNFIA